MKYIFLNGLIDNIALTGFNGIDIIIYHTVVRYADFEIM